ncbi:DUF2238 domain-containing protein [Candidatus Dojkabacteria bacterium]|uniref:DUF2238 domain-containing protein n=1 Tax=Candidatus Dojkabacteria bacterium TaxID=2099670 RepID=A0A847VCK1_9BACT|nr:DUF2238 domain-containing protein [Candidatus Dojkabacteria bacterium]
MCNTKEQTYWILFIIILSFHIVVLSLCLLSGLKLLDLSVIGITDYVFRYIRRIFLGTTFLTTLFLIYIKKDYKKDILKTEILFSFSLPPFLDTLGNFCGWYDINNILKFLWYDDIVHFLVPIFISFGFYRYFQRIKRLSMKLSLLLSATLTLTLSSLWEIYEYWSDRLTGTEMVKGGLDDTILDLSMGLLGVFLFSLYIFFVKGKSLKD